MPESDTSILEVVKHMGAMQAQDLAMAKWAIGSRALGSTVNEINEALDRGEILRTHLLRPTWHIVSAADIRWMLELTAARIKKKMKPRDTQLGLTPAIIQQSKSILVKALEGGEHLTKEAIDVLWEKASIPTTEYRDAHLLMHAELDGLVCSGKSLGNVVRYALMEERVQPSPPMGRDEALSQLAQRYFSSHGPATVQDFIWWSGLTVGDAKSAVESVRAELHFETIGSQTFLFANDLLHLPLEKDRVHVLPAFDEFIVAYKDRTATLIPQQFEKVVSNNGVFRPALVLDGKVIGVWRRTGKKDKIEVEATLFSKTSLKIRSKIENAFKPFGQFNGSSVITTIRNGI